MAIAKETGRSTERRSSRSVGNAASAVTNSSTRPLDMRAILGKFAQAVSIAVVCQRSLAALELAQVGDEEEALRAVIRQLRDVYAELDGAMGA
jgi:hypothetical protein